MRPIVFLHIPKTAGQVIHHALSAMVGAKNTSPIRVNDQAKGGSSLPPGYLLHSGHLDWPDLEKVAGDPFVFTVLRDPAERIGSFYFYMLGKAKAASKAEIEQRVGLPKILQNSADDYFFGGDERWQSFVRNLYFNFYCSYFITRRFRGRVTLPKLSRDEVVDRALAGAKSISRIYRVENLAALEDDIERLYGHRIKVADNYANTGDHDPDEPRWTKLMARMERDESVRRMQDFVTEDRALLARLSAAGRLP